MALQKSVEQPNGAVATYHKVVTGTIDFTVYSTTIVLASYLNSDARKAGKEPLATSIAVFDAVPTFNGDPRIWAYDQLKANGWGDSTDV